MPRNFARVDRLASHSSVARSQRHLLMKPNERLARLRSLKTKRAVDLALIMTLDDADYNDSSDESDSDVAAYLQDDEIEDLMIAKVLAHKNLLKAQGGPRCVRVGVFSRQRNISPIRTLYDALSTWGMQNMEERLAFRVDHLAQVLVHLGLADQGFGYESLGNAVVLEGGRSFFGTINVRLTVRLALMTKTCQVSRCCWFF